VQTPLPLPPLTTGLLNLPLAQSVQDPELAILNWPPGQAAQKLLPMLTLLCLPAGQGWQPEAVLTAAANCPSSQVVQVALPLTLNVPAAQATHEVL
jgi:hypothetical protein